MPLRPLSDRIVVRPDTAPDVSKGGIAIPDVAQERQRTGLVLAVGPGPMHPETGDRIPMDVAPGDHVVFGRWCGKEATNPDDEKETLLILTEPEVIGKVDPPAKEKKR